MTDHAALKAAILAVPLRQGRRIIAIAGPPASGKSTLAEELNQQIPGSCVLPMDGFHKDNAELEALGLLPRKGAPETFDVAGLQSLITAVAAGEAIEFPTFDRSNDRVVPAGGTITADHHTILVEGNYLLLNQAPWAALHQFWDLTVKLEVPYAELEKRLIARWLENGFDHAGATARAQENDLPNARRMQQHSVSADMVA